MKDIAIVGASTAFAGTAGYFGATKHALRGPTARIAMVIGASGGTALRAARVVELAVPKFFCVFVLVLVPVPMVLMEVRLLSVTVCFLYRFPARLPKLLGSSHGLHGVNAPKNVCLGFCFPVSECNQ